MAKNIITPLNIATGGSLITSAAANSTGLVIKGASGQSVDVLQIQNTSSSILSGFDSGYNLFVNNTYYGFSVASGAPASTTYWKIATLPISSAGTYDHIIIDAILDDNWGSTNKARARILLSNRNAFTYRYYLDGTVRTSARIVTYTETDGSVSVYLQASSGQYTTFSYNITHAIAGVTIYKNPTSTTTAPTGTLSFDSGVIATYVPEVYIPYTGQPIIRGLVNTSGVVTASQFVRSSGTSTQFLKADGSVDSSTYIANTASYFAGHNPEGRLMYNTYLTNDIANARLRGSNVSATQNGVSYVISDANWDAMFDGTASFFNISPANSFTYPLVITVPLPRTLTYGTWVGLSFGSTTFRANNVQIEVFSLDSSSWVTVVNTITNTSEDIFAAVSGLTNGNATGINQIRYTISSPNSSQLRLQHLWAYNFNSDMWSQTMMPRAGGQFYGPITANTISTTSVPLTVKGAVSHSANLQEWQNSSSTILSSITSAGNLNTGQVRSGTTSGLAQITGIAGSASTIGAVIRGAAAQTANLQEWQNSTPTTVAFVSNIGAITAPTFTSSVATGTAPFVVSSTTQVANLNVAVSGLAVNLMGGTINKGELVYQSAPNVTSELAAPTINNQTLAYNTTTNAPFWVTPTLSNTYYAATTSAQLAGVISDETGSGALVFGTSPVITPNNAVAATSASQAGFVGMPQNSQSGAYTLVAADAGKHIYYTVTGQTVTIPNNTAVAFEVGTTVTFITAPSVSLSIAINTDTLRLANTTTTGTRTLAANGIASAIKVTSNAWLISGNGLS